MKIHTDCKTFQKCKFDSSYILAYKLCEYKISNQQLFFCNHCLQLVSSLYLSVRERERELGEKLLIACGVKNVKSAFPADFNCLPASCEESNLMSFANKCQEVENVARRVH